MEHCFSQLDQILTYKNHFMPLNLSITFKLWLQWDFLSFKMLQELRQNISENVSAVDIRKKGLHWRSLIERSSIASWGHLFHGTQTIWSWTNKELSSFAFVKFLIILIMFCLHICINKVNIVALNVIVSVKCYPTFLSFLHSLIFTI